MTAMLTQALVEDGRLLVVEGSGGSIAPSAIVRATVTKYEAAAGGIVDGEPPVRGDVLKAD